MLVKKRLLMVRKERLFPDAELLQLPRFGLG